MYQKLRQTIFAFAFIVVVASNSHHQIVDAQQINSGKTICAEICIHTRECLQKPEWRRTLTNEWCTTSSLRWWKTIKHDERSKTNSRRHSTMIVKVMSRCCKNVLLWLSKGTVVTRWVVRSPHPTSPDANRHHWCICEEMMMIECIFCCCCWKSLPSIIRWLAVCICYEWENRNDIFCFILISCLMPGGSST